MSDETKPSPGPWRACHEGDCKCGLVWSIPEDRCVATVHREDETGAVPEETRAANMRLIASAPRLRAALEEIERHHGDWRSRDPSTCGWCQFVTPEHADWCPTTIARRALSPASAGAGSPSSGGERSGG